ncbi:MAG: carbohydrate ABC transporter permease [Clostridia bacterium]|nr:carbohydrate ABC transporter permease [Clostridia bacterium]
MQDSQKDFLRRKRREHLASHVVWPIIRAIILIGICFLLLYPLLYMFVSAFRAKQDLYNPSVIWITRHWTMEHITTLIDLINYPKTLMNTVSISVVSAVIQMLICSLVGYGFARFRFKGKGILFSLVILTIIIPPHAIINSLYMTFRFFHIPIYSLFGGTVNLINTPAAFWVQALFGMGLRSGLFIFIYRQFFRGMPSELENAALIDGCNPVQTYLRVMLPNALMVMVTVFMFSLVWHWNDTYNTSILAPKLKTLSTAIADMKIEVFRLKDGGDTNPMLNQVRMQAGALLSIAPMMVVFLFGQKTFTESVERTGIVG